MGFSPVNASNVITKKYIRYLKTIFEMSDVEYMEQFNDALLRKSIFAKGPFLDVTDSFSQGKNINELIDEKILSEHFREINISLDRPLYRHQELALKKILSGKNVIVSTGTGSGKTECYLLPIFNLLMNEKTKGILSNPGVRALIIYPMNALVNDQIERLRKILSEYSDITYGCYTGQTKEKYKDALSDYKALNNNEDPLENELISREQMKSRPPHILITNYAMLEYLMIRPGDSVFFDREHSDKWKYVVLDEAHVYKGSTGIEVSMLLRRLQAKLSNRNISYILTSATLGDEEKGSNRDVAEFATQLCDSTFSEDCIIRAIRQRINGASDNYTKKVGRDVYRGIAKSINDGESDDVIIKNVTHKYGIKNHSNNLSEFLYDLVSYDYDYFIIRQFLEEPRTVNDIANYLGWSEESVVDFVSVASKCMKNGVRLFEARYHMFFRATEGVFITLYPNKKLFLQRKKTHHEATDERDYHVFEVEVCDSCHAIYLVGKIENNQLNQSSVISDELPRSIFLLSNSYDDSDDENSLEENGIGKAQKEKICSICGCISVAKPCEHDEKYHVDVIRVQFRENCKTLTKCLSCENKNPAGILRKFFSGHEAVTSVLGTALYSSLPSHRNVTEYNTVNNLTGFGFGGNEKQIAVREAKQFIAFSDSRQAAAYFASYFEQTYKDILYKRLIMEVLNDTSYPRKGKSIEEFVSDLTYQFEEVGIKEAGKEAWKAVLKELVDNKRSTSLSCLGLVSFSAAGENISKNSRYNLSKDDVGSMISMFLMTMLTEAAVYYKGINLPEADRKYFTSAGFEYAYTFSNSDYMKKSFVPAKENGINRRSDYLFRILLKSSSEVTKEDNRKCLEAIWDNILLPDMLIQKDGAYKVNCNKMLIRKADLWFRCGKCKKITPYNVLDVCPTFRCNGKLTKINMDEEYRENHYYNLYQELELRPLSVVEHTAQLDKETAYSYQKQFVKKEIDVLSCSTTFEMGVDVGTLETVFMRNMPPTAANYAQRAGRAGRRKDSAAYALTFCNKSNHDFSFFNTPEKMIRGNILPPRFNVLNEKIAIRHLYASTLSFFWNLYPEYYSNTSKLLEEGENGSSGYEKLKDYINSHPTDLCKYLHNFLPKELSDKFGIKQYKWTSLLINDDKPDEGALSKAISDYEYEVNLLEDAKKSSEYKDNFTRRINNYKNENIISFLSRKNVLPKYGFPVDTVEMLVIDETIGAKLGLELQRDLSMAISEYAPGSEIVANGNLIKSRYIRKMPKIGWKIYDYVKCNKCQTLNVEPFVGKDKSVLVKCNQCGEVFGKPAERFLIPEFGFVAESNVKKPGLQKPEKTYRGDVSYVGKKKHNFSEYQIGDTKIEIVVSSGDEMSVINDSHFFVCENCGYTVMDSRLFGYVKDEKKPHKNSIGRQCTNRKLERYSLGYRFETDVVQVRFLVPDIEEYDVALSILYGFLRGIIYCLDIEQNDISGCVQYFFNESTKRPNYSLVLFDKTPGGAGHIKRINSRNVIFKILNETKKLVMNCNCGGEIMDSSCYACLRDYYNQKYHDILKRSHVYKFLDNILQ